MSSSDGVLQGLTNGLAFFFFTNQMKINHIYIYIYGSIIFSFSTISFYQGKTKIMKNVYNEQKQVSQQKKEKKWTK